MVRQGEDIRVRLLVRGEFLEVYIDDKLAQCYGFMKPVTSCVGLFAECDAVELKQLKLFEFDL